MTSYDRVRDLKQRIEVLAPAGRRDALEAVLAAGADAVYIGAKRLNMRSHRGDFHFSESDIADAVSFAHELGRRLYVTVNALIGESELGDARDLLRELDRMEVDAVIVQDLATIRIARELGLAVPLHASTMMNVHNVEHARMLKSLGITRIIPSRDISLEAIGELARLAGIEVECFAHGDMCVAQSGQCSMSGVLFGKSANRGECMKPCRWEYDLVRLDYGETLGNAAAGRFLAIKDLCMIRHIPEMVQAGISSLKIEGRMRDARYLSSLVGSYRQAVDAYYKFPATFRLRVSTIEDVYRNQVRELSTLTMLGGSSHRDHFDTTGRREPLFLSDGRAEAAMDEQHLSGENGRFTEPPAETERIELAVSVADAESAFAALEAEADRIYLAAEVSQLDMFEWTSEALVDFIQAAHDRDVRVGMRTPRVTTSREWSETAWLLERMADQGLDYVLVHHLGTLALARGVHPGAAIIADLGFNLLNSTAIELLAELGAGQVTVSNEAGYEDLAAFANSSPLDLEILVHGPVMGMLIDHCVIALHASPLGRKDTCRGPCRHVPFGLRDRRGEIRPIIADQHCRNHLLAAHDLAVLGVLERFRFPSVRSMRIEGQFYSADVVAACTRTYRAKLSAIQSGAGNDWERQWRELVEMSPRRFNLGPYARSIVNSPSTASVMAGAAD